LLGWSPCLEVLCSAKGSPRRCSSNTILEESYKVGQKRYLTRQEMDALLSAHELSQWAGRRDHALLLTLYNTGARVSEMTGLQKTQVHFGTKSFVQFKGKGRKERAVPLWSSPSGGSVDLRRRSRAH
jgi:site-specific recombinase XerD